MYLRDGRWQEAYDAFFSAFRSYQEAGSVRAKTCLKCGPVAPATRVLSSRSLTPTLRCSLWAGFAVPFGRYVVLTNMMSLSDINPFDSREARALQDDTEIQAMNTLRTAYAQGDVATFERVLGDRRNKILEDDIIATCVPPPPSPLL